jgi:hypothetical protein
MLSLEIECKIDQVLSEIGRKSGEERKEILRNLIEYAMTGKDKRLVRGPY